MNFIGIDEAGLGPILGPFCVGRAAFSAPEDFDFSLLLGELSAEPSRSARRIVVDDSKKIFSKNKGIELLERTVLSFMALYRGSVPRTVAEFLAALNAPQRYGDIPWYNELSTLALPLKADPTVCATNGRYLAQRSAEVGVELRGLQLAYSTAGDFNRSLHTTGNKALTCRAVMEPLLAADGVGERTRIIVDQQGGRRYYAEWLRELYSSEVEVLQEGAGVASQYRLGERRVEFHCKADQRFFEVALASLIAKYTREIFMHCFNDYWQKRCPGIAATAGYPQDGKRFLGDLERAGLVDDSALLRRAK